MPAPPRKVAPMKASRTCDTCWERWSARPAHTPPTTRPSTGRRSRGCSGTSVARAGGRYGVGTPPSSPTSGPRPSTAGRAQGRLRVGSGSTLMARDPPAHHDRGMTSPTSESQRSGLDAFFSAVRGIGIRRRTDNKWVGGVCSGIADRLRIDPVVVRALLVVLIIFGGFGVAAYLIAWALLPDAQDRIAAERALREGHAGSIVLLVIAAIALLGLLPWTFGHGRDGGFPWGLFVIGAVVWFVVHRSRSGRPVLHPRSQAVPPATGAEAGPGEGLQEPAAPGQASSRGQAVGEPAGAWGQQVGERAGTWGQQVGRQGTVRR